LCEVRKICVPAFDKSSKIFANSRVAFGCRLESGSSKNKIVASLISLNPQVYLHTS